MFGGAYANLVRYLYNELDRGGMAAFIAFQAREDIERGMSYVTGVAQGYYLLRWGWVLQRLIDTRRGLKLIEQALEIGQGQDRQLESQALNNMAAVYRATGQPKRALELFEQALPLRREVGDRAGEATTLNNMAEVYRTTGQPQRAVELHEQVLPIIREVGDRAGEAVTLNNMAAVYGATGQPDQALEVLEQALPLRREVGDRAGEATTLNNLAMVYRTTGQPKRALEVYEQALPLMREVGDRAGEATTLTNKAIVLYEDLNRSQEAITSMEQAIAVLVETGLPQDSFGHTRDEMQHYLDAIRHGLSLGQTIGGSDIMPSDQLQAVLSNTITVMTTVSERRVEGREVIVNALQDAQQHGADWQIEGEFFTAVLAILDGEAPVLPGDHPYAPTLAKIQEGIAAGRLEDYDTPQDDDLPFDAELISRSIAALSGGPQEKMVHGQYLAAMSAQTTDEEMKALLQVIQLGLFGSDLSQLGQNLSGVYREAWETIIVGVETGGVDPRLFEMIVQNTLVVLGPAAEKRSEWREALTQIRSQAMEGDAQELVALLDEVIGLLDAGGNQDGLGMNLKGAYARTWQAIVENLPSSK